MNFQKSTILLIILTLGVVSFSVIYILQVNDLTQKTFLREDYRKRVASLEEKSKLSELGITMDNSLNRVKTRAEDLSFKEVENVSYIRVVGSQVVTNR